MADTPPVSASTSTTTSSASSPSSTFNVSSFNSPQPIVNHHNQHQQITPSNSAPSTPIPTMSTNHHVLTNNDSLVTTNSQPPSPVTAKPQLFVQGTPKTRSTDNTNSSTPSAVSPTTLAAAAAAAAAIAQWHEVSTPTKEEDSHMNDHNDEMFTPSTDTMYASTSMLDAEPSSSIIDSLESKIKAQELLIAQLQLDQEDKNKKIATLEANLSSTTEGFKKREQELLEKIEQQAHENPLQSLQPKLDIIMSRVKEFEKKFMEERQALVQEINKLQSELNKLKERDAKQNKVYSETHVILPDMTNQNEPQQQQQQQQQQPANTREQQVFFEDAINAMELNFQQTQQPNKPENAESPKGMEIKIAIQHKSETAKLFRLLKDKIANVLFQTPEEPTRTERSTSSSDESTASDTTPLTDNTQGTK